MQSQEAGFWVPVALSSDLPAGMAMPVTTPQGRLALWRSREGQAAAFADRCPHRGMRLSHGFVRGEALSCIYHGWSYGRAGNCVRIPAHPSLAPPAAIRVATHSVEESGGIVWIAAGLPHGRPPEFEGFVPLRSLTVDAGPAAIETAACAKADARDVIVGIQGSQPIRLLLSNQKDELTLVHVLVEVESGPAARIAATRAAESVRRAAEKIQREGMAA